MLCCERVKLLYLVNQKDKEKVNFLGIFNVRNDGKRDIWIDLDGFSCSVEVVDADLCDESLDMEFWAAVGEN